MKSKKKLGRELLAEMLIAYGLYLLAGAVCYGIIYAYYHSRIWYGTETFYLLIHMAERSIHIVLLVYAAIGALLVGGWFLVRSCHYLDAMTEAAKGLAREDDQKIVLPSALVEYEAEWNDIKQEIQKNRRAAQEAEQKKNDLVVYLAHDLKTPLTSVIGYLTLLSDEREISEELQEKYLQVALDKAERLEDLINEFFEITRFSLTHLSLEMSHVNLTRMLEQTLFEFRPMLQEKQMESVLHAPSECSYLCDPEKLQRVFDNLLRNAVNYGYPGTELTVVLKQEEKQLILTVENAGPTIPEEKLQRIFEQFFRLDTARTSRSGGSGLGLAIAKEIVELHGGTIRAESQDEKIRFIVCLPV